jgi:beta-lactamase class A
MIARQTGDTAADFAPLRQQIKDYLATQPVKYNVYFQDLITGKSFGIGATEPVTAASTTKLPTVLYLYTLAAEGKIDLNEKLTYEPGDYQDGSGILAFYVSEGDKYSLQTLANLAITLSDNIANQMLLRRLGRDQVTAFMRSLGAKVVNPAGDNKTTAADLATYLRAVLELQREHPAWGGRLLDEMEHTTWNAGLNGELPDGVRVAHKYGATTDVANDYGVVLGSRPYILVVLSGNQDSVDAGFQHVARISKLVYDYQQSLAEPDPA